MARLDHLYKREFNMFNNPNTVIEPTTECQLKCPNCYRVGYIKKHRTMSRLEMFQYIDDVKAKRNSNFISFLGGEPLLHPDLNIAIAYATRQGFNTGVYTNGILLSEDRLKGFEDLGVKYIMLHVDRHQGRDADKLRKHFVDMFRGSPIEFGFSFIVHEDDDLDKIAKFSQEHIDAIKYMNWSIDSTDDMAMCERIRKAYDKICETRFDWCCYLASKHKPNKPGKLTAIWNGKNFVYTPELVKFSAEAYHRKYGKHFYMGSLPMKDQTITISLPPKACKEGINTCNPCTDAVLYRGAFVSMCMLEGVIDGYKTVDKVLPKREDNQAPVLR